MKSPIAFLLALSGVSFAAFDKNQRAYFHVLNTCKVCTNAQSRSMGKTGLLLR